MELDVGKVEERQRLFSSTLKSSFLRKITQYKNVLLKNGINLADNNVDATEIGTLSRSESFEEHIELVLSNQSESPSARKTLWKIGKRLSVFKLFRWISEVVQRKKAARVLQHLDGVLADDLEKTILSVGTEISIAFEYQLVMLAGNEEVIILAQHASACMVTYLNSNDASFLPENLLMAILETSPSKTKTKEILKTRAVFCNNVPVNHKWRLRKILKQPGLRIFVKSEEAQNHHQEQSPVNHSKDGNVEKSYEDMKPEQIHSLDDTKNGSEKVAVELASDRVVDPLTVDLEFDEVDKVSELDSSGINSSTDVPIKTGDMQINDENSIVWTNLESDANHCCNNYIETNARNQCVCEVTPEQEDIERSSTTSDISETDKKSDFKIESANEESNMHIVCTDDGTYFLQDTQRTEQGIQDVTDEKHIAKDDQVATAYHLEPLLVSSGSDNNISNDPMKHSHLAEPYIQTARHDSDLQNQELNSSSAINIHIQDCRYISKEIQANTTNQDYQGDEISPFSENLSECFEKRSSEAILDQTSKGGSKSISKSFFETCQKSVTDISKGIYKFYGCFTPFGAKCRPDVYGFRGPLHVWSEKEKLYTTIFNDTVTVKHNQEIARNYQDFHQRYEPRTSCCHLEHS